jgi:hypothetical protein
VERRLLTTGSEGCNAKDRRGAVKDWEIKFEWLAGCLLDGGNDNDNQDEYDDGDENEPSAIGASNVVKCCCR